MNDLISIIVPIYNTEIFLEKCINSLLTQTYKNLEIILVIDGSKDNSLTICEKYAILDERIRIIVQENQGLAQARNNGMKIAKGEFIAFVDSDDYVESDMYKYLHTLIKKYNSDISICGHNIIKDNNIIDSVNCNKPERCIDKMEAISLIIDDKEINNFAWDKLYKKNLFDDIKYLALSYHEDVATTIKIFGNANSIAIGNKPMYNYVRNINSICFNLSPIKSYHSFLAYLEIYNFINLNYQQFTYKAIIRMVHSAVASINIFVRNDLYNKNYSEISNIRKQIKKNLWLILFNNHINITCKMYCAMSVISMSMYRKICLKNMLKFQKEEKLKNNGF